MQRADFVETAKTERGKWRSAGARCLSVESSPHGPIDAAGLCGDAGGPEPRVAERTAVARKPERRR